MLRNMIDAIPNGGALTIKSRELSNSVKILFSMIEIDVSKNSLTKQILRKIWKPRFSANTETIEYSLPICRRIIEAHGGKIVVENVAREGTVIAVNIPIEPKTSEETEIWVNIADSLMTTIKR
jgi:signal transduction histidine kinase